MNALFDTPCICNSIEPSIEGFLLFLGFLYVKIDQGF